jgi:hypothetical protein
MLTDTTPWQTCRLAGSPHDRPAEADLSGHHGGFGEEVVGVHEVVQQEAEGVPLPQHPPLQGLPVRYGRHTPAHPAATVTDWLLID